MDGVERNVRDVQYRTVQCIVHGCGLALSYRQALPRGSRNSEKRRKTTKQSLEQQDDSQHSVISSETGLDNYNVDPNGTAWHTPGPAYMFWAYIFGRFSLPSLDLCQPLHFATPHSETEIDRLAGVQNDSPHYMHYSSPCTCIKKKTRVNISAARVARLVLGP